MDFTAAMAGLALAMQTGPSLASQQMSLTPDGDEGCSLDEHTYCQLTGRISADSARSHLGSHDQAYWITDGLVHVVARRDPEIEQVRMCCVLQTDMERLSDDGLWGTTYALRRLDEAILAFWPLPAAADNSFPDRPVYRGPDARPAPPRVSDFSDTAEAHFLPSSVYGRDRRVSLYVPPGEPPEEGWPTIFVADGGRVHSLSPVAEALANQCRAQPVVMIGLWPGEENGAPATDEVSGPASDARSREYLWGSHPASFELHQRWLVEDLIPLAQQHGGASHRDARMTFGASSGAAWALSTGLLQAELIGHVAGASLGWPSALDAGAPAAPIDVFIGAGLYEPGFNEDSRTVIEALQAEQISARYMELVTGHAPIGFELVFADALEATFPAKEGCVPAPVE